MKFNVDAKLFGEYDVVVCGAGTAGCFAAIAAAREGAKTLLIERSFTVGGMLTAGDAGITKFTEHCKDVDMYKAEVLDVLDKKVQVVGGISHEYVLRMINAGYALGTSGDAGSYVFTDKAKAQLVMIQMLEEAGVEIIYDSRVCHTVKEGELLKSVVVLNKEGFSFINAKQFIDATGDADVAYLSGVPFVLGASEDDVKEGCASEIGQMQHPGAMFRVRNLDFDALFDYLEKNPKKFHQHEFGVMALKDVKESYKKGEMCVFRFISDMGPIQVYNLPEKDEAILLGGYSNYFLNPTNGLNARDLARAQNAVQSGCHKTIEALRIVPGFEKVKITYVPDIGVRETRHIIGEYKLSVFDVLSGRDFEDSIACGGHPLDIHPLPKEVENADFNHWRFHIPYRVMLPKKVENLLVTGRCISASRGASGATRPTAQCMALGEAAGRAAAIAIASGTTPKQIDVQLLRKKLINNGGII